MISSFAELWEAVENHDAEAQRPLQSDVTDTQSTTTYSQQDSDFWQKLADVANTDPDGLAQILGADPEQVATWHGKIKVS